MFLRLKHTIYYLGTILFLLSCGGGGSSSGTPIPGDGSTVTTSTQRALSSGDVDLLLTSIASTGKKNKKIKKGRRYKDVLDSSSFENKTCLIILGKLSDPNFTNVVGMLKTDKTGRYELKTEDVFSYLKSRFAEVGETADFADLDPLLDVNRNRILTAFKKLGVLRLRAIYDDGGKVVSMDFFQNVSESNPNILVKADPRNRIVAHWVEKIFADLGIIPTENQYIALNAEISTILEEILKGLALPEGVTLEQFADAFKSENALILLEEQKTLILSILGSTSSTLTSEEISQLSLLAGVKHEAVSDSISNEISVELTGLINNLGDQIQSVIEKVLKDPSSYPAFAKLLTVNGVLLDSLSSTFKTDFEFESKKTESLIRFFISLGFPVVVEPGSSSTEPLFAIAIPLPGNIPEENLPGKKHFGDRNIRAFKVSEISTMVTAVNSLFSSQEEVDGLAIKPIDSLTSADFIRLERLRVFHGFLKHLKKSPPLVSAELIDALADYEGTVALNSLAATMVDYFVWRQEAVSLVDDGKGNTVPVFTGGLVPPSTGEEVVASEIIRKLSIQLGSDPISAVDSLTFGDGFLFQFIGEAIREGMNRSNAQKNCFCFS